LRFIIIYGASPPSSVLCTFQSFKAYFSCNPSRIPTSLLQLKLIEITEDVLMPDFFPLLLVFHSLQILGGPPALDFSPQQDECP
jgi:hypothetical protein